MITNNDHRNLTSGEYKIVKNWFHMWGEFV